jgi:two-component sensor histidine kinase/streptogramin lyase
MRIVFGVDVYLWATNYMRILPSKSKQKRPFFWLQSLFLVLCPMLLMAQATHINTNFISFQDGLADWTVSAIHKDHYGFVWIGTENGLQRFDGYKFLNFNTEPGNPNRISDHFVHSIHSVKEKKLAIFYEHNLNFLDLVDPQNNEVEKIELTPAKGVSGVVRKIRVDDRGNILVIASTRRNIRVFQYHFSSKKFHLVVQLKVDNSEDLKNQWLDALQIADTLWLIVDSRHGIFLTTPNEILRRFPPDRFKGNFITEENTETWSTILHRDKMQRIWLAFHNVPTVFQYDVKNQQFIPLMGLSNQGEYSHLWEDQAGNLLLDHTNGLGSYPIAEELFCYTKKNKLKNFSNLLVISPVILDLYSDDFFNTIFFGIDTGLKVFRNNQLVVRNFLSLDVPNDQFGRVMRGITSDGKQNVFFAAENSNWYTLNRNTQKIDTIFLKDEKDGKRIDFSCCFDLEYDKAGYVWGIACKGRGLGMVIRYNISTKLAKVFNYPAAFKGLVRYKDGCFLLLAVLPNEENALLCFNPEKNTFELFTTSEGRNPFQFLSLNYIISSKNGHFWIGTNKGLFNLDFAKKQVRAIRSTAYLDNQIVYALYEDQQENLWVGTSFGLVRYHPKEEKVKFYGVNQGLSSGVVSGVLKDQFGNLWVSTHDGLNHLDLKSDRFTKFFDIDGISHNSFTRYSFFRDNDNTIYFGTVNGINALRPEFLQQKEDIPPVQLTSISKYDKRIGKEILMNKNLRELRALVVKPWESNVNIEFSLPVYTNPKNNNYFVKLVPDDGRWISLGNEHHLLYAQLTPGKHELYIRGNDPRGGYSKKTLALQIIVEQHFYTTRWFFICLGLFLLALAYFALKYWLLQQLKMERIRTQLASNIHDEVSGLLAGIALQSEVLQWDIHDPKVIEKLKIVAEVSRKAMSKLHDVIWSADARRDHVQDLLIRMQEHADDVLSPLNIRYDIKMEYLNLKALVPVQVRQDLYFIFKEAINNVAKHVSEGSVLVVLKNEGQFFIMSIKDNGKNVPSGNIKSGQGLKNMSMRAKRIHATLTTEWDGGFHIVLQMKRFR